jgi:hypothetical protein
MAVDGAGVGVGSGAGGVVAGGCDTAELSMIVAVPVAVAKVAPWALVSTTVNCSFDSVTVSAVIGIEIV